MAWGVACLAVPGVLPAAAPVKSPGAIAGTVRNSIGVPQMGATVLLYNRQERTIDKALTDTNGNFRFAGLIPDLYGVKVFTAALIPAIKKDILVQPGMQSVLAVRLNSLISTIQLSYPPLENGSLMTDDWKWALRTELGHARGATLPGWADHGGSAVERPPDGFLRHPRRPAAFGRRFAGYRDGV